MDYTLKLLYSKQKKRCNTDMKKRIIDSATYVPLIELQKLYGIEMLNKKN
jgi:hypothetical protein